MKKQFSEQSLLPRASFCVGEIEAIARESDAATREIQSIDFAYCYPKEIITMAIGLLAQRGLEAGSRTEETVMQIEKILATRLSPHNTNDNPYRIFPHDARSCGAQRFAHPATLQYGVLKIY